MAITKAKKTATLEKLGNAFKDATSVVFVGFHGLSVKDATELRNALRNDGTGYVVAKKTLIKKALTDAKFEGEIPELPGEVAVAHGATDVTLPASGVYGFVKKLGGALSILGGVFEGALFDASRMTEIATIPPKPVLYGKFVFLAQSPIQRFAIALNEISKKKEA